MTAAHALKPSEMALRARPDGKSDPAGEAGWFLERERTRKRLTLTEAREDTGVPVHLLIALEQGRLDRLPPVDESIRIISAYGNWLGFDPAPLCGHYINLFPRLHAVANEAPVAFDEPAPAVAPAPAARRPRTTFSIRDSKLIGASAAAIMTIFLVTAWQLSSSHEAPQMEPAPQAVTAAPLASPQAALPAPVAPPAELVPENTALQGLSELINETIAAVDASGIGPRAEPIAAPGSKAQPPVSSVTQNGRQVFGAENTDARVVLEAKGQVWLRVEDASGNVVATVTFKAGDEYRVPLREDLVVIARDGGLISYKIDGVDKGTLGNPGEILVGKPISVTGLTG
ncbi:MAG: helix-turn-helix domain-containing protein [Aestuariivirgaceae bacterium]|nr:helix-turn-helix domain-containing protein [Aestuariivirgaceae bacterium]